MDEEEISRLERYIVERIRKALSQERPKILVANWIDRNHNRTTRRYMDSGDCYFWDQDRVSHAKVLPDDVGFILFARFTFHSSKLEIQKIADKVDIDYWNRILEIRPIKRILALIFEPQASSMQSPGLAEQRSKHPRRRHNTIRYFPVHRNTTEQASPDKGKEDHMSDQAPQDQTMTAEEAFNDKDNFRLVLVSITDTWKGANYDRISSKSIGRSVKDFFPRLKHPREMIRMMIRRGYLLSAAHEDEEMVAWYWPTEKLLRESGNEGEIVHLSDKGLPSSPKISSGSVTDPAALRIVSLKDEISRLPQVEADLAAAKSLVSALEQKRADILTKKEHLKQVLALLDIPDEDDATEDKKDPPPAPVD